MTSSKVPEPAPTATLSSPVPTSTTSSPVPEEPAPALCEEREQLPLLRVDGGGYPQSTYVRTRHDEQEGVLHFDTASARTLIVGPGKAGYVEEAGVLPIGCRAWPSAGYFGPFGALPDVEGLPVLGSAGVDLLATEPSLFDVRQATWTRRPTSADLAVLAGAAAPAHVWDQGVIVVEARFDEQPVRLVVDTGAGHSVWLHQSPKPGDLEIVTQDYLGNELHVFQGQAKIEVGGVTRTLPILRVPSFPGVEEDFDGRDIQGLLGLSVIDVLFVDAASSDVRIVLPPGP